MATNTAGSAARQFHHQMVHYLRKTITYADNGDTVIVGYLPAGAVVLPGLSAAMVSTAFNGDTTNTVDIGITGSTTKYASALALGTVGWIELDVITESAATSTLTTAVEEVIATVVSTASASAGSAEIVVAYIPDNDG